MFNLTTIFEHPLRSRQRRLADARPPLSQAQFIDRVASTDLGRLAAGMLWSKLSETIVYDDFTPYPNDDLLKVFGLAEEDLDEDVILEIIKILGCIVPDNNMLVQFGSVNTPLDIIQLIEKSNGRTSSER